MCKKTVRRAVRRLEKNSNIICQGHYDDDDDDDYDDDDLLLSSLASSATSSSSSPSSYSLSSSSLVFIGMLDIATDAIPFKSVFLSCLFGGWLLYVPVAC